MNRQFQSLKEISDAFGVRLLSENEEEEEEDAFESFALVKDLLSQFTRALVPLKKSTDFRR